MYVLLTKQMPNGAQCAVHRVSSINISETSVVATVNSFTDASTTLIGWQERIDIPTEAMTGSPYSAAANYLTDTGQYLGGGIVMQDPGAPTLDQLKAEAWVRVRAYRDDFIQNKLTCTTNKGVWDYDAEGRDNIKDAIEAAAELGDAAPAEKQWRMHDNADVLVTVADLKAANLAGIMAKDACYQNSWAIEAQQQAAADEAALAAIDITAGYPA